MYLLGYTLHLGVHTTEEIGEVMLETLQKTNDEVGNKLSMKVFFDGDSFFEWGEKIEWDEKTTHPMHLSVTFQNDFSPRMMAMVWAGMEGLIGKFDSNLVDYLVVTDHNDWSEDVRIIIAEDIVKVAHQVLNHVPDEEVRFNWSKAVPWRS